jgi:hypothetical protein
MAKEEAVTIGQPQFVLKHKNPDARPKQSPKDWPKTRQSDSRLCEHRLVERAPKGRQAPQEAGRRESVCRSGPAKRLSDAMGGIDKARAALNVLAKILDA